MSGFTFGDTTGGFGGGGGTGGGGFNFGGTGTGTGGAGAGTGGFNFGGGGTGTGTGGFTTGGGFDFGAGGGAGGAGGFNFGGTGAGTGTGGGFNFGGTGAGGWGAPAPAAAAAVANPNQMANAFDRRDQMTPAQRVMWIAHMQNITQQMGSQLEAVRKAQEKRFQEVSTSLDDVKKAQDNLQSNFEVTVLNKLPGAKLAHLKLAHRLVVVMKQIELLRLRNRNTSSIEEEIWRSKLQSIKKELDRPDQFSGRLKEVSSRVKLRQDNGAAALAGADYDAIDQEALETTAVFLEEQREGIEKLLQVLNQDMHDVRLMGQLLAQTE